MIFIYVYFNSKSAAQVKIEIKKKMKIKIICSSLDSLKTQLAKLSQLSFSDKFFICKGTKLMSNEEIIRMLRNDQHPPINFAKLASLLLPKLNFAKNKPRDLPAFIQEISPFPLSREEAESVLKEM